MSPIIYYLITALEAGLGIFGIRAPYEQPRYTVAGQLDGGVQLREYPACVAAETDQSGDGSAAFGRLFRYITGANASGAGLARGAAVSRAVPSRGELIAMTVPVQSVPRQTADGAGPMRFFLPRDLAARGAPAPNDPLVRIVAVPARRIAVLRFSGVPRGAMLQRREAALMAALARAGLTPRSAPFLLTYDAPFTIPFLRRNEIGVDL